MNKKCQVFTPKHITLKMLEIAGYKQELFGKKILENSCGDGQILMSIVGRYIESALQENRTLNQIKKGLENDVVGVELSEVQTHGTLSPSELAELEEWLFSNFLMAGVSLWSKGKSRWMTVSCILAFGIGTQYVLDYSGHLLASGLPRTD
ncbi:MAG: hypothetical protein WCD89_06170 [Anaerocolumna sp.]